MEDRYRKRLLRQTLLRERSRLIPRDVAEKSRAIFARIQDMQEFREARLILCYADFRGEVATGDFIRRCLASGKQVALPRLAEDPRSSSRYMETRLIESMGKSLTPGTWGILEPDPGKTLPAKLTDIDFAVIPGVAFDLRRFRLGYGMGYFDAYLAGNRGNCLKVGVGFDLQVIGQLPVESHDVRMDRVVTESRVIA